MFGGVCFLINGSMYVVTWKYAFIVRLGSKNHEATLFESHTKPADITGRGMKRWH